MGDEFMILNNPKVYFPRFIRECQRMSNTCRPRGKLGLANLPTLQPVQEPTEGFVWSYLD